MGETQIYSQRLHGINEKRRILGEVDAIQRELEQQRLKLQQLKRKSLRDRWLMDGLAAPPGSEAADNPFCETEGEIRKLQLQLENLQSELVYLENPELKVLKATKVQALQSDLVNGDGNRQQVDQNENHKERTIREADGQGKDPAGSTVISSTLSHKESVDHSITPARENTPPDHDHGKKNLEHTKEVDLEQPNQGMDGSDQKEVDGDHKPFSQENDLLNSKHSQELQDQEEEHGDQDMSTQDHDHVVKVLVLEKLNSLENIPQAEEQHLKNRRNDLGHVHVNFDLQPSPGNEDIGHSLVKQDENNKKESLLDEITKLVKAEEQKESNEPSSSIEEHGQKSKLTAVDQLDVQQEEGHVSGSDGHEQGNCPAGEIVSLLDKERSALHLLNAEEPAEKPTEASLEANTTKSSELVQEHQKPHSEPLPLNQSSALPPSDQEERIPLPCTDQVPSPSLPFEDQNQVDQVQTSQVLVVSPPGLDSNSKQDPSASHQPGSTESNTPPESQPLIQKPPETDGHREANTAETRDKSTPVKKKTCQCCVVM